MTSKFTVSNYVLRGEMYNRFNHIMLSCLSPVSPQNLGCYFLGHRKLKISVAGEKSITNCTRSAYDSVKESALDVHISLCNEHNCHNMLSHIGISLNVKPQQDLDCSGHRVVFCSEHRTHSCQAKTTTTTTKGKNQLALCVTTLNSIQRKSLARIGG